MKNQVVTFGCRLNSYESEVIKQSLDSAGRNNTVVFNTCAVTKEAERQARQAIRKYKKNNPDAEIIVTGCSAQIKPEMYSSMPEVSQVLGNQEKLDAKYYEKQVSKPASPERAKHRSMENLEKFSGNDAKIQVNDIMSVKETASHLISGFEDRARAFLQVQNGCNHRCTFCIIPYGRGNSRSVPIGEIVLQAKKLVEAGFNEIVLTGVDITDYGLDLPGKPTLGQMMKRLLALVPDLKRLRLSSIDVAEIDEDIMNMIESEPRLMPHIHLSLQSGDDMILKRMKRRHTRQQIIDFCKKARTLRPDVVFGADIIAGFPTETDAMFENTLNIIEEAGLTYLHVFPYSEREGTPAAKMPQVAKNIRKQRAAKLRAAGEKAVAKFLMTRVGQEAEVVMEKDNMGRSEHFAFVKLSRDLPAGTLVRTRIVEATQEYLVAA